MRAICGTIHAVVALAASVAAADVSKTVNGKVELAKAEEVHVRKGVGNFLAKLKAGKPVTVAYLGGSITAMDGWRNMTTDWLRKAKTGSEVTEVHASIGGTGSDLGVFRLGHDALSKNPDLLFVEFATNDGHESAETIWRNFDGIVQQTWRKNPKTDIVFTYTITKQMMKEYGAGNMNHAASAMERLADHYGIPSVCFGPRVADEVKAGRLVMSLGEFATAVPKETPDRDKVINEELKKKGQTLFAKDGVHPALPGHEFYLKSIVAAFKAMRKLPPARHAAFVGRPFFDGTLAEAKMVPVDETMLVGEGWTKLAADEPEQKAFGKRGGQFWRADRPGARLSFRFRGTKCGIYDLLAPRGANVRITVDGKVTHQSCPRFDSYCTYTRLAPLWVFKGENGEHSVEIEVLEKQPDRTLVKKEPTNTPKYDGTWFQPCQIMVVGDVVTHGKMFKREKSGNRALRGEVTEPKKGSVVSQILPEQKAFFALSRDEKFDMIMTEEGHAAIDATWPKEGKTGLSQEWGRPQPIRISWELRGGGQPLRKYVVRLIRASDGVCVQEIKGPKPYVSVHSLEIATRFLVKVYEINAGRETLFAESEFETEDYAPRLLDVSPVNARDLGGRIGLGGRRVRQGVVFRSAGLNPDSKVFKDASGVITNFVVGRFPNPESAASLTARHGIKTDLDLRSDEETYGLKSSPLGKGVKYVQVPATFYGDYYSSDKSRALFKRCFDVFLDDANYPILFHCRGGADRTGSLAFMLNALLGVSEDELDNDFLMTRYSIKWKGEPFGNKTRYLKFVNGLKALPGKTLADKAASYCRQCGITDKDISRFRGKMLEQ
jgi:protein tyrosine/serine phosphatase